VADRVDSKPGAPVFNRAVTLRDSWAKKGGQSWACTASRLPEDNPDRPRSKPPCHRRGGFVFYTGHLSFP